MTEKMKWKMLVMFQVFVCVIGVFVVSIFWIKEYQQVTFVHISKFCEVIIEDNPQMETQVLSALKEYQELAPQEMEGTEYLMQYGYKSNEFGKRTQWKFLLILSILLWMMGGSFVLAVRHIERRSRRRIEELTNYLEQVNVGADGTIIQTKEDEFSQLQDEMYKTVTTLYQTREEAVKAKNNYADNLANIAHQLKTPITAAFLSLQLMKKESPNAYAEPMHKQLQRLNGLEEALLTLSRIDAGTLVLEQSKVDIYTALSLAADNLSDLLEKDNLSVLIPEKGCMEITGDLEWTMEALMNLMKNCMEHSPRGGQIHCDYSENPLYVQILIWDEGSGFCKEDMPHLFERFYRGKRAVGNGMGIGLALARSIFELQNGNITARNLVEGGACFEIRVYSH